MIDSIPAVVGWIFVLIFAATASIVMLDLAGFRRIKDRTQRKWLFRGVIVSVVVAVGGLGTALFKNMDPNPPARTVVPATLPDSNLVAPAANPPAPVPADESDRARVAPAPEAPAEPPPANGELAEWASKHLGMRPVIPAAFSSEYPGCVAKLQQRAYADIDPGEVAVCQDELNAHHQRYIVAFYNTKLPYDAALDKQELLLRARDLTSKELVLWNFVNGEKRDLNSASGDTNVARVLAEARILGDMSRCGRRRCTSSQ